jgi:hypothetical protein
MQGVQDPLIACLLRPQTMAGLSLREWDSVIPRARVTLLLSRLAVLAERGSLLDRLPPPVRSHLATGLAIARNQERVLRWELQQLEQLFAQLRCPVLLLKGAAYAAAGLPLAEGRIIGDVDIMVPPGELGRIERELLNAGWEYQEKDEYDRRYYLQWMHELPPMQHRERLTVLDVHHAILPRTSRLKPDAALLWASARPIAASRFLVLCPEDMMLHSAAHLFQDGDLHLRLRDLFDLHEMASVFGREPGFWAPLLARAETLELGRPLYYALRYCARLFGTEFPAETLPAIRAIAPLAPAQAIMDRLVPSTLIPPPGQPSVSRQAAALLLFIRSHWLRMPPLLLAAHLARKSLRRAREARQSAGD